MRKIILYLWLCAGLGFSINAGADETAVPAKKQILFVCTGNYYRSRFAEALFNLKAAEAHSEWRAVSRGLRLEPSQHGISALAWRELKKRGVPKNSGAGDPKALAKADLERSDYIVLMDEAEHRPMLERGFPKRDDRKIHYWHIGETEEMSAPKACAEMAREIEELLRTLER